MWYSEKYTKNYDTQNQSKSVFSEQKQVVFHQLHNNYGNKKTCLYVHKLPAGAES